MRQKSLLLLLPFLLLSCGGKKNSGQLSDTAVQIVKPEFPQIVPFETGIETEQEILLRLPIRFGTSRWKRTINA